MANPDDCSDHQCTCADPMSPGMLLWECGSNLCRAIKDKMPVRFDGVRLYFGDEDAGETDSNS